MAIKIALGKIEVDEQWLSALKADGIKSGAEIVVVGRGGSGALPASAALLRVELLSPGSLLPHHTDPEVFCCCSIDNNFGTTFDGIQQLAVSWHHAERVRRLPPVHRDPFDRSLIAQAVEERFTLVTVDRTIAKYPVECLTD